MERLPEDLQIYIFEIVQKLKMENVLKDIKKMNIPYDSTDEDDEKKHTTLWVNNEYLEEHRIFLLSNWAVSVDLWRPHIYTDKKYIIY